MLDHDRRSQKLLRVRHVDESDPELITVTVDNGVDPTLQDTLQVNLYNQQIFLVLNVHASSPLAVVAALTSLPLGWATVHVMAAFHYAHLHYRGAGSGMIFPGTRDPDAWDFLYTSFTVGMTAQFSDVEIASGPLRRAVLLHGVASFFYNAVILALAVNAALSLGK